MQKSDAFQRNSSGNDSTVIMPSLFPDFHVNFGEIRFVYVAKWTSSLEGDSRVYLLIGNELHWLTENSVDTVAILTDIEPQTDRLKILDIKVIVLFKINDSIGFKD